MTSVSRIITSIGTSGRAITKLLPQAAEITNPRRARKRNKRRRSALSKKSSRSSRRRKSKERSNVKL